LLFVALLCFGVLSLATIADPPSGGHESSRQPNPIVYTHENRVSQLLSHVSELSVEIRNLKETNAELTSKLIESQKEIERLKVKRILYQPSSTSLT